jgi:hypothetical protein
VRSAGRDGSAPAIAEKLRAAEEELARLEAQVRAPVADVELLVPRLAEEIERSVRELPKTLAAGNVDLARQELKGYLGSIRVVAEPTRMLLYSERGFVEAAVMRTGGTMEGINGSGGAIRRLCRGALGLTVTSIVRQPALQANQAAGGQLRPVTVTKCLPQSGHLASPTSRSPDTTSPDTEDAGCLAQGLSPIGA